MLHNSLAKYYNNITKVSEMARKEILETCEHKGSTMSKFCDHIWINMYRLLNIYNATSIAKVKTQLHAD